MAKFDITTLKLNLKYQNKYNAIYVCHNCTANIFSYRRFHLSKLNILYVLFQIRFYTIKISLQFFHDFFKKTYYQNFELSQLKLSYECKFKQQENPKNYLYKLIHQRKLFAYKKNEFCFIILLWRKKYTAEH